MNKKSNILSLVLINFSILTVFLSLSVICSRTVTTLSESAPMNDRSCIVIDAGHGGVDGGATSCTGILESKINLDISIRLDALLHLLGVNTRMIRNTDVSIYTKGESIAAKKVSDLKNRVAIVNSIPNATLVSIHQNHFSDSRYSGAQVFYAKDLISRELAEKMQTALIENLKPTGRRRAKKADGVYLMENIKNPGILIECGFLSNTQEEALLRNEQYQKKLCCVIGVTILEFIESAHKT